MGRGIEWTGVTWNPVSGCTKTSSGCAHCYAERIALRMQADGNERYRNGFRLTLHDDLLEAPLHWRTPRSVFVCSMSDLFHENVPDDYIRSVFRTMERADWHSYRLLTKRSERLARFAGEYGKWPRHVWAGVTVERADYAWRIEHLRQVPATVRFLSVEPLLGPLPDLDLTGIHQVILGGESGPDARPLQLAWVRDVRDQCRKAGVAFYCKQLGSAWAEARGAHDHKGADPNEMPRDLRIREHPAFDGTGVAAARPTKSRPIMPKTEQLGLFPTNSLA